MNDEKPAWVTLYVAFMDDNEAVDGLREGYCVIFGDEAHFEVVDVLADFDRAVADGIIVTPTLVRHRPLPERRVIGRIEEFLGAFKPGSDT